MLEQDKWWEAVQKRDQSRDGTFFCGVLATGVYCQPPCPSRRALLKNVRF
jgi:AraC family transcriptional regulator of adaptative response/methylated-DNA-[protein]-cysteine methyltransferase